MKKQILLLFLLAGLLNSQAQNLSKFKDKSGKYGFKSSNGTVVIKPIYEFAWENFTAGLVGVKLNKKWGYIDSTGKTIAPFKYDEVSEFLPDVKLARVFIGEKMGYVNNFGKEIIPVIYYDIDEKFYNNVVCAALNNKCGAINSSGKIVVPFVYDTYLRYRNGLAITNLNRKYGVINKADEKIIPFIYDTIQYAMSPMKNLFIVKLNKKVGVLDIENKNILPVSYDKIEVNGDLFKVKKIGSELYGFYDKSGKRISEHDAYSAAGYIGNNTYFLAIGNVLSYMNSEGIAVDKKGNKITE